MTRKSQDTSAVIDIFEASRKRRLAALTATSGLWKDRTDIPGDGVEYQRTLRENWDRED